jgi:hypothetical protein
VVIGMDDDFDCLPETSIQASIRRVFSVIRAKPETMNSPQRRQFTSL